MPFGALQREPMAILDRQPAGAESPLHEPAMVPQVVDLLRPSPGEVAVDLTVGTGGHSLALAAALAPDGLLIGIDADRAALRVARARLQSQALCRFMLFAVPFSQVPRIAREAGVEAFNVALADLGVGTHQLSQPERGFSFDSDARLDMRYDPSAGLSAWDVVNHAPEEELAGIFHQLGEERYSRQIAGRICRRRAEAPINTGAELAELVISVVARRTPRRRTWRIHPATRVMMALRIYVNHELEELDALLRSLPSLVAKGGRAGILTYHSLEARRVKQAWRRQEKEGIWQVITPSPAKPTAEQVSQNPRVRSAQLRAARRL